MFRFTAWMERIEPLVDWLQWFRERGVPAAIVSRGQYPPYALWRGGVEQMCDHSSKEPPERWKTEYRIELSVNGFDGKEEVCRMVVGARKKKEASIQDESTSRSRGA